MTANSPGAAAAAELDTGQSPLATTPQGLAVIAIGAGLVLAIVGVGVIVAVGKTVPTQLWYVITSLSGALLGMLIPSPAQRRALKVQQRVSADADVQKAAEAVRAKAVMARQAEDVAAITRANAAHAESELAVAPEDKDKLKTRDLAVKTAAAQAADAVAAQDAHEKALEAQQAVTATATEDAENQTAASGDPRIAIGIALAIAAAAFAAWLYTTPGQDSQCIASVGTLTTTVVQASPSTGTTTSTTSTTPSGGAPARTVTNVSTLTIGQIATPHPTSTSSSAAAPAGTPQILKTATGSSTKCPAVITGDALLALALGVLAAILGILVPTFKPPETTWTPPS